MDKCTFESRMAELTAQIDDLPEEHQERLRSLAGETRDRHHSLARGFDTIRNSMDGISLNMKYMAFDLEATKRECQTLRERLEDGGLSAE